MDFQSFLRTTAQEINEETEKFFTDWMLEVGKVSPKLLPLNQAFIDSCDGGKRLRGALVKLGYELAHGSTDPEILKPASAFEIFQTAILIHDDIIDQSPTRRCKPTLYKALGGDHYGISQSISLGDIGFFLAEKLITGSDFPDDRKNKALAFFIKMMLDTALGEVLDVELPHQKSITEEDILTVFRLKTARYTIVGPLCLGAILGGADEELLFRLGEFGESLGIAFQIQDDILGVFGDEKVIGKSVASDIEEGKSTLLYLYALKHGDSQQREVLEKYYGRGKIGEKEHEQIKEVFKSTGALDSSCSLGLKYVVQAKKIIREMAIKPEPKKLLLELADFLVNREK